MSKAVTEEQKKRNRERAAQWVAANPERARRTRAAYAITNRDTIKQAKAKYYAENKARIRAQHKEYREDHRIEIATYKKSYYVVNREEILSSQKAQRSTLEGEKRKRERDWQAQGIIGLTLERYNRMSEIQKHTCAICHQGSTYAGKTRALDVDHCHNSGTIRGLLCVSCNRHLGLIEKYGYGTTGVSKSFPAKAFIYLLTTSLQTNCPQHERHST
jgi:hypothetical protein